MSILRRGWYWIILAIFCLLALFSLTYILQVSRSPIGGMDFHSYWYSGHFLRQGTDPYQAYLNGQIPDTPVRYLDLPRPVTGQVAQPGLANVPANTAPISLLLSLFSFFSWPTARLLWLLCNLALLLAIPWLLAGWLKPGQRPAGTDIVFLTALVFALFGTRNSTVNGQTSLLIYALMLASLISAERSPLGSGIALGIALSKYSLSLPVFLLFVLERRWKALFIALLVQVAALLFLSAFTRESPFQVLDAYRQIMLIHADMPGIHLASLFPTHSLARKISEVGITLLTMAALVVLGRRKSTGAHQFRFDAFTHNNRLVFDLLVLWTLLVAYHRAYDSFILLSVLLNTMLVFRAFEAGKPVIQRWLFGAGILAVTGALILPASGFPAMLARIGINAPENWSEIHNGIITLVILLILVMTIGRTKRAGEQHILGQA